ncbi:MAG TPA: alpha/beta hydrolase [Leptospiraceae bacterium]|nr:alpha/beta hydrolase [Leptospiraceae bacterium]HMY67602.1 alpha/beta hydrolase [Leptospiraceae bacterium]HNF15434.1 alpha/beta hydrolase [Leptospiraceae bacterium]HNF23500.1 alpha/beta hydrolase [Leptospiraceae bacterium]HNH09195.1 alpha/beta hydrolase [Leptospiraceae bacterium]
MSQRMQEHQRNGKFVNVDGLNIFTVDQGKGEVILLLHGLFSTSFSFRKLIPILSENHRVIAPDLPGVGLSEKFQNEYSHRALADFLYKYISEMTDQRVHLVAYDYGAAVSALLLNEHPEVVKTYTVISGFTYLHSVFQYRPLFFIHTRVIGSLVGLFLNEKTIKWLYNKFLLGKSSPMEDELAMDYYFLLFHGRNKKNFIRMSQCIDRKVYARKDMETGMQRMIGGRQILIAEEDFNTSYKEIENMKLFLRLSIAHMLPGGRMIMEDAPEECASKIEALVKTFSRKV